MWAGRQVHITYWAASVDVDAIQGNVEAVPATTTKVRKHIEPETPVGRIEYY